MDDTISRQAAIEALHTWFKDGFDEDKWWNSTHVLAAIEGLPPAQHSTNLAEVGTDLISRAQAIDGLRDYLVGKRCPDDGTLTCRLIENEVINKLPPIQPEIVSAKRQADTMTSRKYWRQ